MRRMRELYGARLATLQDSVRRYLKGAVELPDIQAGLNSPAYLVNGMKANAAAVRAAGAQTLSGPRTGSIAAVGAWSSSDAPCRLLGQFYVR